MTTDERVKRLEWAVGGLVACLGLSVALGAAQKAPREIRAEKVTIVDAEGNGRIVLKAGDKMAGLWAFDRKGERVVTLGVLPDGGSTIGLFDPGKDDPRAEMSNLGSGTAEVSVGDQGGRSVRMASSAEFRPTVEFRSGDRVTHSVP